LRIDVAIKFASGDLTIDFAQKYVRALDRLQHVIPDPNFTMIFLGSYCPDGENPANFELRNHAAFLNT
jgi:hypothetical protein